jgi:antitoxin VapB
MDEIPDNRLREMHATFKMDGVPGISSSDRLVPVKHYRAKVFKSGNSLALRLPAALGLEAGMEMSVSPDGAGGYHLRREPNPKRKFNIDKVWGSATNLKPIDEDDRWFQERELDWGTSGGEKAA